MSSISLIITTPAQVEFQSKKQHSNQHAVTPVDMQIRSINTYIHNMYKLINITTIQLFSPSQHYFNRSFNHKNLSLLFKF